MNDFDVIPEPEFVCTKCGDSGFVESKNSGNACCDDVLDGLTAELHLRPLRVCPACAGTRHDERIRAELEDLRRKYGVAAKRPRSTPGHDPE